MSRPLSEVAVETLVVVLSFTPRLEPWWRGDSDRPRAERLRAFVLRVATEPDLADDLVSALGSPSASCVASAWSALVVAIARDDLAGAARVLWSAARTDGPAWRVLERRARTALVVEGLSRCPHHAPVSWFDAPGIAAK